MGVHAQWSDDFHHALHALLTGDRGGYYMDFGDLEQLSEALRSAYLYKWDYSRYRRRRHGASPEDIPSRRFVVFSQNHDQVGNHGGGLRLASLTSLDSARLAAGLVILSPYVPLLFMGEEYAEDNPFHFFVDHSDPGVIKGVREGRKAAFEAFGWPDPPPDPTDSATFEASRLDRSKRRRGAHAQMLRFYGQLIELRKSIPALANLDRRAMRCEADRERNLLTVERWCGDSRSLFLANLSERPAEVPSEAAAGEWRLVVDSADSTWGGPGALAPVSVAWGEGVRLGPRSFALYSAGPERRT
jgi:maltooligosyltrehalose trehalohydrolase